MKKSFYFLATLFVFLIACSDDDSTPESENNLPEITNETTAADATVTLTSVEIKGAVDDKGKTLLSYGVVWGNSPGPTIDDNIKEMSVQSFNREQESSNSIINFTALIEGLEPGKNYYFRVYAQNDSGVAYGEEISLETESLAGTKWDFFFNHDPGNVTWHGDVEFYEDGTAFYDEPDNPGLYATDGTWTFDSGVLTYYLDGNPEAENYVFTGAIEGNTMKGTYTFDGENKEWTAVKY
jgi:hypothetical protein